MAEEPVVNKRARVREEVVVGKETSKRTEQIRDTVRRTEVEVERIGEGEARRDTDYTSDFRRDYDTRYASSGVPYETMAPAYDYGYRSASVQDIGGNVTLIENRARLQYTIVF